ncbi:MAG: metallophosphatase family protein [Burkholderiaceae bacterium]|nr:metallophosphatase family protein [Burkholderiaceae bacterium]
MKIGVVSDSHDHGVLLADAVMRARDWGAQAILHCGDIIGPNSLRPALALGLPLHVVHGNNLGDMLSMQRLAHESKGGLTYYGADATFSLGGRRLFMTHYPHLARGMACTGDFDAVFCGHSHVACVEQVTGVRGNTPLVNPGTVAGLGAERTMVLGDLERLSFEIVFLGDAGGRR